MTQPVAAPAATLGAIGGRTLNGKAAAQIRALMAARRRTSAELAEVLGMSQSAASRKLNGESRPFNLDQIQAVADWLDVPITDIITPVPGLDYSPTPPNPGWLYQGDKPKPN
jgi:transcriptional regulator with XRE-family HTH domain